MKRVLILGKNSYLGESLNRWLNSHSDYYIEICSTLNYEWRKVDFTKFDTVVDFAGIAHINHITDDMKDLFYAINCNLTIEIGKWAKAHGVKHFIFLSSMNVYGDYCDNISDRNKVNPKSFYGDSKLQADNGLQKLEDETFHVAHVRPPFVYGKGCSGNYNTISKISKKIWVFPTYKNLKSMIYIDNLCEFIRLLIEEDSVGIFTPQNKELVSTFDLVKEISKVNGNHVWFTGLFNWIIPLSMILFKSARKAFSNDNYELGISNYFNYSYCLIDFSSSIEKTEKKIEIQ